MRTRQLDARGRALMREQLEDLRSLAAKLERGGPRTKARAQRIREQIKRAERSLAAKEANTDA